jgi:hypothetical protein
MPRFEPIEDVVDSLCLRSGDITRRKRGLYLDVAQEVWNDLNETTLRLAKCLKMPIRKSFQINKRTNSIDMPCDFLRLSSVNVMDECGVMYPVYRNLLINDDLVDVPADKNCACEHNCGYQLCNTIKGYVAVQNTLTDFNPDGSVATFNAISRIVADRNGFIYQENQYPKRIYTNGVWTSTILFTESTKVCQCEVDHNGCIKDTPQNVNNVCDACSIKSNIPLGVAGSTGLIPAVGGNTDMNKYDPPENCTCNSTPCTCSSCPPGNPAPQAMLTPCIGGNASCPPQPNCDEWIYYCDNKMDWFSVQCGCFPCGLGRNNVYNIGQTGNRLVFPANFGFEKVVVRYYEDISLEKLMIPYIAKQTFMTGLQAFAYEYNPAEFKFSEAMATRYSRQKWGLFLELQKMRIKELGQTIAPASVVPSYMDHRDDRWYYYY